jgi:hypothetical protein
VPPFSWDIVAVALVSERLLCSDGIAGENAMVRNTIAMVKTTAFFVLNIFFFIFLSSSSKTWIV